MNAADVKETMTMQDQIAKHVEFVSGWRRALIAQDWDEEAAEELIISMVAQGRA